MKTITLSDHEYAFMQQALTVYADMDNDMSLEELPMPDSTGMITVHMKELHRTVNEMLNKAKMRNQCLNKFGLLTNENGYVSDSEEA